MQQAAIWKVLEERHVQFGKSCSRHVGRSPSESLCNSSSHRRVHTGGLLSLTPRPRFFFFFFSPRFNTSDTTLILSTFTPDVHVSKNRGLPNPSEPPASSSLKKKNTGLPRWLSPSRCRPPGPSSIPRTHVVQGENRFPRTHYLEI